MHKVCIGYCDASNPEIVTQLQLLASGNDVRKTWLIDVTLEYYGDRSYFWTLFDSKENAENFYSNAKNLIGFFEGCHYIFDKFEHESQIKAKIPHLLTGYVYLVKAAELNRYKIGRSKNPQIRFKDLQQQSPASLTLIHLIQCADAVKTEKQLHKRFSHYRVGGEWFNLNADAVDYICALGNQP